MTNNPNGRPKGIPNKVTIEVRKCIVSILSKQIPNLEEALQEVKAESPSKYVELVTRLFPYVAPKLRTIQVADERSEPIKRLPIWINDSTDHTSQFIADRITEEEEQSLLATMTKHIDEETGQIYWKNRS